MEFDRNRGYFYGALLGDGHIHYTKRAFENGKGPMLMLKVCDYDFIDAWKNAIKEITGFDYKISKHNPGVNSHGKRQQFKLRVSLRWLVDEAENITKHKTEIPLSVLNGSLDVKKSFITGLMDSEGWINFCLSGGVGQNDMTLGFACGDPWFEDFYHMVQSLGVKTSKIYKRPPVKKKNGEDGKILHLFRMDIPSYINAGLGFSIKRKADRLEYCSRILNDYTLNYPKYKDYYGVDDIV